MSELQSLIHDQLKMCEYYLNNYAGTTSKQYYLRLRRLTLRTLVKLQIKEFNHDWRWMEASFGDTGKIHGDEKEHDS